MTKKIYRVPVKEWIPNFYNGGKAPTLTTVKRRIKAGIIPGSCATGDYIVYCYADYEPVAPPALTQPPPRTGNPLADAILQRTTAVQTHA